MTTASSRKAVNLNRSEDVKSFRGPWRMTQPDETFVGIFPTGFQPGNDAIAGFHGPWLGEVDLIPVHGPVSSEKLRLARLIAVAPQMLAALRLVLESCSAPAELDKAIERLVDQIDED